MKEWNLYLGGQWKKGSRSIIVHHKYSGEVVAKVNAAGPEEVDEAVRLANEQKLFGNNLPVYVKHAELLWVSSEIRKQKEFLALNISRESGKPLKYALAEVDRAAQVFSVAAEEARRLPKEYLSLDWTHSGHGREGLVKWFPAGVVAGISPFNFPLNLAVHKIAPALAAGCPILLKPASQTPTTVLMLAEIVHQTEHINKLLYIIPSERAEADRLVSHPDIQVLSFTGSPEVGWDIKARAGKKKVVLELGGNAAVIIDRDTDIVKHMSSFIFGAFSYSGQVCIHAQRFLVHHEIYDFFRSQFILAIKTLKTGNPEHPDTDISVMIDEANAKRVCAWTEEALKRGARVVCGHKLENNIYHPTLLENVPADCKIYAEEAFGPVAILEPFYGDEDAVVKANTSRFGLQCGVFTNRMDFLRYCFENIEAGGIIHNHVPTLRFDHMPYGGVKDSGMGREGVAYALRDYMEPRLLVW